MSQNQVLYTKQGRRHPRRVFFTGSTALKRGTGVCYDRDYGTAADADERRDKYVEAPTTSNNRRFAGVLVQDYAAKTGGQWVEIYEPGSVCDVAAGVDTTVNVTRLTCSVSTGDKGRFTKSGFEGRGTALALQTETVVLASGWDGADSVNATAVTATGFGTNAAAGDKLVIVAGQAGVTPGEYTITAVPDANSLTLASSPSKSALAFVGYVIRGNPCVLALLEDGEESGLQEVVAPVDKAAAQSMVGGVSYIMGGFTIGTGDSTATLADGTIPYEKKGFIGLGTLTTNGWKITVTTGKQLNRSTALASIEIDAAAEEAWLRWFNTSWVLEWYSGATLA